MPGLDRGADGVEVLHQPQVEGERRRAGGAEEVQRHARGAAVHDDRDRRAAPTRSVSSCSTTVASTAASLPKPLTVGSPPCRTAGTEGSSSWTTHLRAGHPGGDGGDVRGEPLGERLREVAPGPGVDDGAVAPGALEPGRQRPRTGGLHLERPGLAAGDVVEGVEVPVQELLRPALVDARRAGPAASRRA